MDTEPPQGDDLQRMLVSMKRNVLDRAAPQPRRRRGRPGIVVGVVALLALGTATGAVALTLSQQDRPVAAPTSAEEPAPAPSATTPTSAAVTDRPSPRPTPTPTSRTATIPTDCRSLVPAADYGRLFGETPLTDVTADVAEVRRSAGALAWTGSAPDIVCLWMDPRADVSGLEVEIGRVAPGKGDALADSPQECQDRDGGRVCRTSMPADGYPVDQVTTSFQRDDVFIVITQTNFPTNGLLSAVVGEIWGD